MGSKDDSFKVYVESELLREVEGISIRRMFDGYGVYLRGVCMGLIHAGTLYFKVDDGNIELYADEGSKPFVYTGHTGKPIALSYWEVPAVVMDNPSEIVSWVSKAHEAAVRSKRKKK